MNTQKQTQHVDQTFVKLDMSEQKFNSNIFENCQFIECDFNQVILDRCRFYECQFQECNLSLMKIKNSHFIDTEISNSKAIGINWTEAYWPSLKLPVSLSFIKTDLSHSTFYGLSLREINIIECKAHDVDFREADLTKANFSHTDLLESMFVNSNLCSADFTYAVNYHIDVTVNKIKKAKFMLPEAVVLLEGLEIKLIND